MRMTYKDVDMSTGRVHVKTMWVDRMRRPSTVKIVVDKNVSAPAASTLIDGEARDVAHVLEGIAEIAWGMGWRPEGLNAALLHAVKTHVVDGG